MELKKRKEYFYNNVARIAFTSEKRILARDTLKCPKYWNILKLRIH